MSMLRIGIAGVGVIAQDYMNMIAQGRIKGRLTALSSRSLAHMQQAAQKSGLADVAFYTDYHEMLESGKIDLVMICTPHFLHPQMAIDALERGIHPLIEKPLGVYSEEAQRLLDKAAAHPALCCGVLYCHRMNEAFHHIKGLLEQGALGTLKRASWMITNLYRTEAYHKSSPWRGSYKAEGGGLLMTQASHQLDLYLWLCGMPTRLHGFCYIGMERDIRVENDATLHMEFSGGMTGQFIASSREFPGTNRLELIGDKGQIILENSCQLVHTTLDTPESVFAKTDPGYFGPIPCRTSRRDFPPAENLVLQSGIVNDFIAAVESGGQPICPLEHAMRSLAVINAAYLSTWKQQGISLPFDYPEFTRALQAHFE